MAIATPVVKPISHMHLAPGSVATIPNIAVSTIVPLTVERSWQIGSSQALSEFEDTL